MEEKQKRILERNRCLLVNNIVLTEEFYQSLRRENVIPETMIRDIESRSSREERNERLLQTLQLRGGDAYRKFRHVLYLTGHSFLADHLYGEDVDVKILKGDELFSKFPNAFNTVSDDVKAKLLKYLETKVRERSLATAWLKSGPERNEVMAVRKICYDNEKDFKFKLDTKTRKIQQLRGEVTQLSEELKQRDMEIHTIQKEIDEMKENFKNDLATQTRFNAANNHSIIQLRQRFDIFNERVQFLNVTVKEFLEEAEEDSETDRNNYKISLLEENVRKLLHFARTNVEHASSNLMERDAVLRMLKTSAKQKHQTLSEVVRVYIDKQERGKMALFHEVERLLEIVRGKKTTGKRQSTPQQVDLKLLKTQVATLRVEIEHVKKKLDWKDNQISDLVEENAALRSRSSRSRSRKSISNVSFPKIPSSKSRASPTKSVGSPDSNTEMERVYQQFDKYISEAGHCSPDPKPVCHHRGSLADVNLERDFSPPPLPFIKTKRSSRVDNVELDILGTGRRSSRERSGIINVSQTGADMKRQGSKTFVSLPEKSLQDHERSTNQSLNKSVKYEAKHSSQEKVSVTDEEGHHPSLADLITIYENSGDNVDKTNETISQLPPTVSLLQAASERIQ